MQPDITATLSAFGVGAIVGSILTLLVKDALDRRSERRRQRIETDRATYGARMTRLIDESLCAFIRSDRYRECDLPAITELVSNLMDGSHRRLFRDPRVQEAWALLVARTAECGCMRISGVITEFDIVGYTRIREDWLHAARESFGPLPEFDHAPAWRGSATAEESLARAA
jgi:hypothetical protein